MRAHNHLPLGTLIDCYRIDGVLGAGGFGVTYRAFDSQAGKYVALKEYAPKLWAARDHTGQVVLSSPHYELDFNWGLQRFMVEAETLAQFRHDCIIKIERVLRTRTTVFIQLEYAPGPSLEQWMREHNRTPTQGEVDGFAAGLTGALTQIHRAHVLHCDISPRNILLSQMGRPIIIDFGSARYCVGARVSNNNLFITPPYSPQELYVRSGAQQGEWTDIYAAAATLYRLITGSLPPSAPERALHKARIELDRSVQHKRFRSEFLNAIAWGMEFLPQSRPQSVSVWAARLLSGGLTERAGLELGLEGGSA